MGGVFQKLGGGKIKKIYFFFQSEGGFKIFWEPSSYVASSIKIR